MKMTTLAGWKNRNQGWTRSFHLDSSFRDSLGRQGLDWADHQFAVPLKGFQRVEGPVLAYWYGLRSWCCRITTDDLKTR